VAAPRSTWRGSGVRPRLSTLAAAHPEVSEIEVNPLLVLPDRVVALDARVALASDPDR
jgi:succinyl-CoA synthetase beta subunit